MLILLAVDGSELALDAVRHALRLVECGLKADFVLANVQEPTHLYEIVLAPHAEVLEAASDAAGHHALLSAEAMLQAAGVSFEVEVVSGDPARTLIDIAERFGCEAIVIGARGKSGLRGPLLGTVAQSVAHDSPLPVTIVKHAEMESDADVAGYSEPDVAAAA